MPDGGGVAGFESLPVMTAILWVQVRPPSDDRARPTVPQPGKVSDSTPPYALLPPWYSMSRSVPLVAGYTQSAPAYVSSKVPAHAAANGRQLGSRTACAVVVLPTGA